MSHINRSAVTSRLVKVCGSSPGVQLKTGLDQPDGVGGCDGCEPWEIQRRSQVQKDTKTL